MGAARRTRANRRAARTPLIALVFAKLADGKFHSGEELAKSLGVSRSAVWKAVGGLRALGTALEAVRNKGYRLAFAGEALDAAKIRAQLPKELRSRVADIEVAWSLESTNTALLSRPNPTAGVSQVLVAEYQSAGRGRRGRSWLAPPGGAICLSLNWTFGEVPEDLGALSLVIGVCVRRALAAAGVPDVKLKWPNDLMLSRRKLGGVLIELRAESSGPACVVIGIGLNVALGADLVKQIAASGIAPTDLKSAGLAPLARNRAVALVAAQCLRGLEVFAREGLKPFIEDWRSADALAGVEVNIAGAQGTTAGVARGIDVHGALLIETRAGVQRFISGEVSVRPS